VTELSDLAAAADAVRGSQDPQDWAKEKDLSRACQDLLNAELAAAGYSVRVVLYPRART
jgi:hypothetical protein